MKGMERRAVAAGPPAAPGTLAAALAQVPDPRRPYGWRPGYDPVPLVAPLQAAVAAMLCGARGLYAVAQWVRERAADEPAVHLVAADAPEAQAVLAQVRTPGAGQEGAAARAALAAVPVAGRVVTGAAGLPHREARARRSS